MFSPARLKSRIWMLHRQRPRLPIPALRRFRRLLLLGGSVALLTLFCLSRLDLEPYAMRLAAAEAVSGATCCLSRVVEEYAAATGFSYETICRVSRDASGIVRTVSADSAALNRIRAEVSAALRKALPGGMTVRIPVGTLTGSDYLSGRGIRIPVRCLESYRLETDVVSRLESAGSNQTCHRILLQIRLEITVSVGAEAETVSLCQEFCLAETVIVGEVPMILVGETS